MTKQEKIQESYKNLPKQYKYLTPNENGWSEEGVWYDNVDFELLDRKTMMHGVYYVRPKSLQGIEDNNGWIAIESDEDLPEESSSYWIFRNDGIVTNLKYYIEDKECSSIDLKATHYQPILKPKPPIY